MCARYVAQAVDHTHDYQPECYGDTNMGNCAAILLINNYSAGAAKNKGKCADQFSYKVSDKSDLAAACARGTTIGFTCKYRDAINACAAVFEICNFQRA